MTPERAWQDLVEGLPQGQPEPGDRGLDNTHTWARTYWGGALFCLRADIEIRKRTKNSKGLEHTLRGIRAAGGTIEVKWPIERAIAIGDKSTGAPVLRELYDEMKDSPVTVPLDDLWLQLGIRMSKGVISFDDTAPLAPIRQAITQP
jgi:predicted metalloprotease with PDZ domain